MQPASPQQKDAGAGPHFVRPQLQALYLNMKNITKQEETLIFQRLPDLVELLYEGESSHYSHSSISTFDHWLTREEADQIFCSEKHVVKQRQQKFENFMTSIFLHTPIYCSRFRRSRKNKLSIKRVTTLEKLNQKCCFHTLSEDSGEVFQFLIPEFSTVYTHGYDWTAHIQYSNAKEASLLKPIAEKSGLFWLNPQ